MTERNIFPFSQPGAFGDPLTEDLRNGAQALLAQAVEAEGFRFPDRAPYLTNELTRSLPGRSGSDSKSLRV